MAIQGRLEQKTLKGKFINLLIHGLLIIGSATMVYPFLLMISGSIKSDADFKNLKLIPDYLFNEKALFKKHLYTKYNRSSLILHQSLKEPDTSFDNLRSPEPELISHERIKDYRLFLKECKKVLPHYWRGIGMGVEPGVYPLNLRRYRAFLMEKYGSGISGLKKINEQYNTDYESFDMLFLPLENFLTRTAVTDYSSSIMTSVLEFKNSCYSQELSDIWQDIDGAFIEKLRQEYGNTLSAINNALDTNYNSYQEISLPSAIPENNPKLAEFWSKFVRNEVNPVFITIVQPHLAFDTWQKYLVSKYQTTKAISKSYGYQIKSFKEISLTPTMPNRGQAKIDWDDFIQTQVPISLLRVSTLGNLYRNFLKTRYKTLDNLRTRYHSGLSSFTQADLPATSPGDSNLQKNQDWHEFVSTLLVSEIGLSRASGKMYRQFLMQLYGKKDQSCNFEQMSKDYQQTIISENFIPFLREFPNSENEIVKSHYTKAINDPAFKDMRLIVNVKKNKSKWHNFLQDKYKSVKALNDAWHLTEKDWEKISLPTKEWEWEIMKGNKGFIIKEYLSRNYIMVFDTLFTNGSAAKNTFIYCVLAVLASMIVNPLCAYGLSRYKPASTYKILLFVMLPMAFPAMVLGIPQFLLIKNLGLLNTFAAIILPGVANGYSIFLLKGFFDNIPKELFESAAIDGASEWCVFWQIAMSLSTPILAVIALNAFTAAYGNFMLAFLLCQDKSLWTMMVYLYQLQQSSSPTVGFAALIIAAIPTLIVFIFCQNMIIKGIVVPTEK